MLKIEPVIGVDPLRVPADGIVLTINRAGKCTSDMDSRSVKLIDQQYGEKLQNSRPLQDGDMVVLDNSAPEPVYRTAIFCADFGERPVSVLTHFALKTVEQRKLKVVSLVPGWALPVIVSHPMSNLALEIATGIGNFLIHKPEYVQHVRVFFSDIGAPDNLLWYLNENRTIREKYLAVR